METIWEQMNESTREKQNGTDGNALTVRVRIASTTKHAWAWRVSEEGAAAHSALMIGQDPKVPRVVGR